MGYQLVIIATPGRTVKGVFAGKRVHAGGKRPGPAGESGKTGREAEKRGGRRGSKTGRNGLAVGEGEGAPRTAAKTRQGATRSISRRFI